MKQVDIFVLLPCEQTNILELLSSAEAYEQFWENLSFIHSFLRAHHQNMQLYYDSENCADFLRICKAYEQECVYLEKADNKLRSILGLSSKDLRTRPAQETDVMYVLWNYDEGRANTNPPWLVKEMLERELIGGEESASKLLYNLAGLAACRDEVFLGFKDAKHKANMPSNMARLAYVTGALAFGNWMTRYGSLSVFSLRDRQRFEATQRIFQGARIYKELATGCYWYLDNFHRNEYEVFNGQCQHVGVADMNGKIDYNQAVKGRSINI